MKKFTILFILGIFSLSVFGQYTQKTMELRRDVPTIETRQNADYSALTKDAIWTNDFSNAADWSFGNNPASDGADWVICTYGTAPAGYLPVYGMSSTFVSPSVANGFALFNSDIQGAQGAPMQDAWIQLVNPIDLSSVSSPRIVFSTYYRKWADVMWFEYSSDAGTTWTAVELFTDITQGGAVANDFVYLLNVPGMGGLSSVIFRYRIIGDWDYGIFIDDISIVNAPDYDLKLMSTATNFFEAVDYHAAGQEQYYHYSSHYGMIPEEVATNENAWLIFNAVVQNAGMLAVTPSVTVSIEDPDNSEIYTFTLASDAPLAPGAIDTLDIAWYVGEEFYVPQDYKLGFYTIKYETFIDGQIDDVPLNNTYETGFEVNDEIYARDGGNLNGVAGPGLWLSGGNDGDMFGVDYTFFEETAIDAVQAYITSTSTAATALICHALQYDSGSTSWVTIAQSSLITIEAADLGTWKSFTFTDPAYITLDSEETSKNIKFAFEFYYNGEANRLWFGEDNTVPSSVWGTSWKFAGDEGWTVITNYYNAVPMIRVQLPETIEGNVGSFEASNISMYPNPTTGIFTIENIDGASIVVLNTMGQIVANVQNASDYNKIDLSKQAN